MADIMRQQRLFLDAASVALRDLEASLSATQSTPLTKWTWRSPEGWEDTLQLFTDFLLDWEGLSPNGPHALDARLPELWYGNPAGSKLKSAKALGAEYLRDGLIWVRELDFLIRKDYLPAGLKAPVSAHMLGLLALKPKKHRG